MSNLNPQEFESLRHHHLYGHRGNPSTDRVTSEAWQKKPIQKPLTATWNQSIPHNDIVKLLNGFKPREMEDKWFVYADGPDNCGNAVVHMHRSWTGYKMVEAKLIIGSDGAEGALEKDTRFTEITWESDPKRYNGQTEEKAKEMAKEVCRWVLGVELP
ncbi:hypothetical protein DM02DRAFT_616412 [Periconia macrospinosa]|uniref:Uncharacterized protein n=1 Tax=Periconia macrospinosa TaxID=97972 RepID=A0A2V1DID4_9PLEO|nr:hypothetical protein DM02DRAFT_616412 [Periconia macrospinosa]